LEFLRAKPSLRSGVEGEDEDVAWPVKGLREGKKGEVRCCCRKLCLKQGVKEDVYTDGGKEKQSVPTGVDEGRDDLECDPVGIYVFARLK